MNCRPGTGFVPSIGFQGGQQHHSPQIQALVIVALGCSQHTLREFFRRPNLAIHVGTNGLFQKQLHLEHSIAVLLGGPKVLTRQRLA